MTGDLEPRSRWATVRARDRVVIIDTAGRLQIDAEMMDELKKLNLPAGVDIAIKI